MILDYLSTPSISRKLASTKSDLQFDARAKVLQVIFTLDPVTTRVSIALNNVIRYKPTSVYQIPAK